MEALRGRRAGEPSPGRPALRLRRLLVDTFSAGLVAFILAMQWRWYINVRKDVKLMKRNLLTGIIDRAHLDEVDIGDFTVLGKNKKPEAPKAGAQFWLGVLGGRPRSRARCRCCGLAHCAAHRPAGRSFRLSRARVIFCSIF